MNPSPQFVDEHLLRIGEVTFHCAFPMGDPPPGRLVVRKTRELVERYVALCEATQPKRIVELGINRGGSTALLSELTRPERLVAVELATEAAPLLTDYIAEHGLGDVVRPHYGVDQADRPRLTEIVDHELARPPSISSSTTPRTATSRVGHRSKCSSRGCGTAAST